MFLLDTVIVSELRKNNFSPGLLRWISKQRDEHLHLSVVTLGEIERGVELRRRDAPEFATAFAGWLESVSRLYAERLIQVSPAIARRWGVLSAQLGHDGADLLTAATAGTSMGLAW